MSKVVGVRLNDIEQRELEKYANTHNITVSAMLKLCANSFLVGDLKIEKGELVFNNIEMTVNRGGIGVNSSIYADSEDTPFGQKVDRKFDKLRERGYPENFIYSMKEQILNGIESQIEMLPKKFDARRVVDGGC